MVLEPPPLLDAPAEEHAAVSAPTAASAAAARSGRGRWSKRIVQSSPAVGATFLHYFAGDAKQPAGPHPTLLGERHNSRRRTAQMSRSLCGMSSKVGMAYAVTAAIPPFPLRLR